MNFLSHFFFDGRNEQPYFNLGLVLPDLMGMKQRGWKIRPAELHKEGLDELPLQQLMKGAEYHLAMDGFFHKSLFFMENNQLIRNYLHAFGIHYPPFRPSFISHVFLEMLMDRVLVKYQESVVRNFYKELARAELHKVPAFFEALNMAYYASFEDFLNRFIQSQSIYDYADTHKFFGILNHIFRRVNQPEFDEWQIGQLAGSLQFLENLIRENLLKLQIEIENAKPDVSAD